MTEFDHRILALLKLQRERPEKIQAWTGILTLTIIF